MKKLVASDMDGTLLPYGQAKVGKSVLKLIEKLFELGVIFAPASGRQLPSLKMLFESVKDKVLFIAENGALVEYKGKVLHEASMSHALAHEIVSDIMKVPDCDPIVSTKETVYITKRTDDFFRAREKEILYTTTVTDNFFSIKESVLKVTACNYDGIMQNAKYFADTWGKFASVTVSGAMYFDFMERSVSKGNALKKVLQELKLSGDDCIVFGDNYNDISMLDETEFAFAMSHADDKVKEHAKYITDNVEDTLRKIYNV